MVVTDLMTRDVKMVDIFARARQSVGSMKGAWPKRFARSVAKILYLNFGSFCDVELGCGVVMSVPPEIAWVIPVVLPFIIGLLVGAIVKKGLKVLMLIAVLVIVLVATGVIGLTFSDVFDAALQVLPKLYDVGAGWLNVLPYSSITFLIGLVLGFLFI
jgi:uncharacterized membrane protein (Fun14 family)